MSVFDTIDDVEVFFYQCKRHMENDNRFFGGFLGPFILGGLTGGLVAPLFNQNNNGYCCPPPYQPPYYTNNNNYYYPPYSNVPYSVQMILESVNEVLKIDAFSRILFIVIILYQMYRLV